MQNQKKFLDKLNQKDSAAWEKLYRNFYSSLCNYSANISGDAEAAEDIVQESLIAIWQGNTLFTNTKALVTYLYRAVYNNTLKYLRDQKNDQKQLSLFCQEQPREEEIVFQAIEEEAVRKIREAIDKLPEQRKQILQMCMEGMSTAEISKALNISENTIKTQKKRAYAHLRQMLGNLWGVFLLLQYNLPPSE